MSRSEHVSTLAPCKDHKSTADRAWRQRGKMLKLRNSILLRFVGANDMTAFITQVSKAVVKTRTEETVETKQTIRQKKIKHELIFQW